MHYFRYTINFLLHFDDRPVPIYSGSDCFTDKKIPLACKQGGSHKGLVDTFNRLGIKSRKKHQR